MLGPLVTSCPENWVLITKTCLFILKILPPKNENFEIKSDILHISAQNIDYGYEAVLTST